MARDSKPEAWHVLIDAKNYAVYIDEAEFAQASQEDIARVVLGHTFADCPNNRAPGKVEFAQGGDGVDGFWEGEYTHPNGARQSFLFSVGEAAEVEEHVAHANGGEQ